MTATNLLAIDPKELIEKAENSVKGKTMVGEFTMEIVRPEYQRELKMKSWNQGNEKALLEVTSPPKEAGNKTLKIGNELWTYLSATETTMKLPSSMLLQSWNGSDLTNDDLVRESSLSKDYNISLAGEEKQEDYDCYKLKLIPKPEAPVVWGSILYWVRKSDYLPVMTRYYDDDDELIRTFYFQEYKKMDGRLIPSVWKIVDELEDNNYTKFIYESVDFDTNIPPRIFSFRQLERK